MIEPLHPGDPHEVAGYRLRGRLGQGGMGSVYLSYTRGGQPVALKVVRPELAQDPEFRRRFEREVQAARRVHGPYTAAVLDSNTDDRLPWLAGAYVAGPPLSEAVRVHGPLPVESVLLLIAGVAEALQSVHAAGVIHRDLKPSNVLLASDGPRVIDFGIARAADTTALTGSDVVVGTPAFMSPEQVLGKPVGFASDVFSLALVGHYAATGEHPFGQGHAQALMYRIVGEAPDLGACPAPLRGLLEPCLAKEPTDRPSLAEVIEGCRRGAEVTALVRGTGWLPAAIAHDAARREAVPPPTPGDREPYGAAAGPPIPPPPMPSAPPAPLRPPTVGPGVSPRADLVPPMPPPVPPHLPFITHKPAPPAPHRRRWVRIVASTVAAVAVVVAGVLVVPPLIDGDDDKATNKGKGETAGAGTDPGNGDGTNATRSKVPLSITAPDVPPASYMVKETCNKGFSTRIDLEKLTVTANVAHTAPPSSATLEYVACNKVPAADGDRNLVGALRFLDHEAVAGMVAKPVATVEECRTAARTASLPSEVPLSALNSDLVSAGMGFCVETGRKTVVLVWVTDVKEAPGGLGLRNFDTQITQWKATSGAAS
ncbi:serine/threonine-protein kinase [Streptomyces sp. SID3343]|uniref:serine/threonine-protein kinase n=1 Tax=Streptomyces sp. SID3343 TaxID=2690260 RepID=UPI001F2C6FD4|nr:serine/threonine-protein kinase [Streptomyces sp. SID3343]